MSLFRIAFAALLLAEFLSFRSFYSDFYSDAGILPLSALAADRGMVGSATMLPLVALSARMGLGSLVPLLYPASLAALALGYRTRWATGAAFVLNAYLYWRNPYLRSGAETLQHLLLLWSLFLPLNRYWSIDAALDPQPRDRPCPSLPLVATRLQIASLYFFAALFKLEGEPWRRGYAVAWTLQDGAFGATSPGLFMVQHAPALLVTANYAVIAFQLSFPYLIYSPWRNDVTRTLAIAAAAAMHLSFVFLLKIGFFPFFSLAMLLLLVPDPWIDRVLRRRRARLAGVAIFFEPGCGFCRTVSLLLREFLLSEVAEVRPASDDPDALRLLSLHKSWVVATPDGRRLLKWDAMAFVLKQNPLLAPLGWATGRRLLRRRMERLYDAIGRNRRRFGAISRVLLPARSERPLGRPALALCATLAGLALLSNIASLDVWTADPTRIEMSAAAGRGARRWFDEVLAAAQVRQAWSLFAPVPTHWQWRLDVRGGTWPPLLPSAPGTLRFRHPFWVKYFARFAEFTPEDWAGLGAYLCRTTGQRADGIELAIALAPVAYRPGEEQGTAIRHRFACAAGESGAPDAD